MGSNDAYTIAKAHVWSGAFTTHYRENEDDLYGAARVSNAGKFADSVVREYQERHGG